MAIKIFSALAVLFFAIVIFLSLVTALTSASASLANGVANAAASTALMTSQCISGFMILVSIIAGAAIGISINRFLPYRKAEKTQLPVLLPGSFPVYQAPSDKQHLSLPAGEESLTRLYLPEQVELSETNVEDVLFKNWGW